MATILPIQIFAMNVAGAKAEVSLLIPPGSDVHEFTLRPLDMRRLAEADLIMINGASLDEQIVDRVAVSGARVADTSEGISLLSDGRVINPHIWLDPLLAAEQVRNIEKALSLLDPENASYYNRNAEDYIKRLNALDAEIMKGLESIENKYLITYHESFTYFARRYGLRLYSLTGSHAEQPLPGRVRKVYDILREEETMAVFAEKQFPEDSIRKISSDLGVRLCTLNSLASGTTKLDYYELAMRENLKNIIECLGGN